MQKKKSLTLYDDLAPPDFCFSHGFLGVAWRRAPAPVRVVGSGGPLRELVAAVVNRNVRSPA